MRHGSPLEQQLYMKNGYRTAWRSLRGNKDCYPNDHMLQRYLLGLSHSTYNILYHMEVNMPIKCKFAARDYARNIARARTHLR